MTLLVRRRAMVLVTCMFQFGGFFPAGVKKVRTKCKEVCFALACCRHRFFRWRLGLASCEEKWQKEKNLSFL